MPPEIMTLSTDSYEKLVQDMCQLAYLKGIMKNRINNGEGVSPEDLKRIWLESEGARCG